MSSDYDNMYPSDGEAFLPFKEPKEQILERQAEAAKVKQALKLSEDIITRYEERIGFYDSVGSIAADLRSDSEKFLRAWLVNREVKQILEVEKEWLEDLVQTYKR